MGRGSHPVSAETAALIGWMATSGVPHVVSGVLGRFVSTADPCHPHARNSYHCAEGTDGPGLAIDVDGPDLDAIYAALEPLGPQCAELIHGTTQWRDGLEVPQYDFAPNIFDHVHIAVPRGTIVHRAAPQGGTMPEALHQLVAICAAPDGDGYWILAADGAVYAFGSAAYAGRLVLDPAGNWAAGK